MVSYGKLREDMYFAEHAMRAKMDLEITGLQHTHGMDKIGLDKFRKRFLAKEEERLGSPAVQIPSWHCKFEVALHNYFERAAG